MSFFISDALAQNAASGASGTLMQFIPLILIFVIFYFLLIRPQMKRAKEHRQLVANLARNDEVVTNGGMLGRVTAVDETFITLEIAPNTEIRVQKHAVQAVMPKGTYKKQ